jgi:5'-nucleotidase
LEKHGASIVKKLIDAGIPKNILINVNFPNCLPENVAGVAVTMQGRRSSDMMVKETDTRAARAGKPLSLDFLSARKFKPGAGFDRLLAIEENKISITPLQLDLTDHPSVTRLAMAFWETSRATMGLIRSTPEERGCLLLAMRRAGC